jgi:non-specific serine/threonine protein kinase
LVGLGEQAVQRRRHYDHFLSVAEAAQQHLYAGSDQQCWFERLEQDHGNFRAALAWAFEQPDSGLALRLAAALWRYWYRCGYLEEGLQSLTAALDRPHDGASAELRGRALVGAGLLAADCGGHERARAFLEEAVSITQNLGDLPGLAESLNDLGLSELLAGQFSRARSLLETSLALERELGDQRGAAYTLNNLGMLARYQRASAEATAYLEEALQLFNRLDDPRGIAFASNNLGMLALQNGQLETAQTRLAECVARYAALGDRRNLAECLEQLARVAGMRRNAQHATRLLGAAESLREALGAPRLAPDRDAYMEVATQLRKQLARPTFESAWREGRAMSIGAAIASIAHGALEQPAASSAPVAGLTERERQVAGLVARGMRNRDIARQLSIAPATAERHVLNVLSKLHFASRAQLAVWAAMHGLQELAG